MVSDDNLSVAKEAMQVVQELTFFHTAEPDGLFFVPPVWSKLNWILTQPNEIARMRVYEIVIKVTARKPHLLERFARLGVWNRLLEEIKMDDVLLQLNALQLITELAETHVGFIFLKDQNILTEMDEYLGEVASGSAASFLLPGFIKFFGVVSEKHDLDFFHHFPNFKSNLTAYLQDDDVGHRILALETMGHICSDPEKKIDLGNRNGIVELFLKGLKDLTESGTTSTDVKVRALNVMQTIGKFHDNTDFEEVKRISIKI